MPGVSSLISKIGAGLTSRKAAKSAARSLVMFSDSYIVDHFMSFGYAVSYGQLAFTTESVADFVEARDTVWHLPGAIVRLEIAGLLIVEDAQPRALQPKRDIVVVSLGAARVVMGAINREGHTRFAKTM
jgi:hypothetical protein